MTDQPPDNSDSIRKHPKTLIPLRKTAVETEEVAVPAGEEPGGVRGLSGGIHEPGTPPDGYRGPRGTTAWITDIYRDDKISVDTQKKAGRRVFRLKGYTTIGKINRKFKHERQQRLLRNVLTTLMIIILLIILFAIYNPFKDMKEFRKISGEDSLYKNRTIPTSIDTTANAHPAESAATGQ